MAARARAPLDRGITLYGLAHVGSGGFGRRLELEDRSAHDFLQIAAAEPRVLDYLAAHPRFPKIPQMRGDCRDRFFAIRHLAEILADIVGHLYQVMQIHASMAPGRYFAEGRADSGQWPAGNRSGRREVGFTWTAVTLYSGQLVAQSEFSVVTTLAALSG